MASPLKTGKQSVNLAPQGVRGSRIRRDPPPAVRKTVVPDPDERDERAVVIGVVTFALAIFVVILALGGYSGWSPREYTVDVEL